MATGKFVDFTSTEENLHYEGVLDIDPVELSKKLDQVELIDVRLDEEYIGELGHIPGARLMTLDTLEDHLNEIPKDKTVVFICRSGARSARATALAQANGFKSVYNLKGGMILWNEYRLKTEI